MNLLFFLIIYIIYFFLLVMINYYINLYTSKDQYTKDEIKNAMPYFNHFWAMVRSKYEISNFLLFIAVSSFFGIIIPFINNWFFTSSIIFVILFFASLYFKKNIEDIRVNTSDDYSDNFANILVKHSELIIIGFGVGLGSSLIYLRGNIKDLWFIINMIIVTVIIEISMKDLLTKKSRD